MSNIQSQPKPIPYQATKTNNEDPQWVQIQSHCSVSKVKVFYYDLLKTGAGPDWYTKFYH